jgi:hypothetical protein
MVKWHPRNKQHYESNGYIFTKYGDSFEVKTNDLSKGNSKINIEVLCDYCKKATVSKPYNDYIRNKEKDIIKKDCCEKCRPLKVKESNLLVYGVESTNQLDDVIKKREETCLIKYGGKNCMSDKTIRQKVEKTNMMRYGTKAPAQNFDIKSKIINTNLKKYGHISPTLNSNIREKQINTMIEKYNVPYPMLNEESKIKSRKTFYQNGSCPTPRQQLYIYNLIGGELNYPIKNSSLDIAFLEENIYLEIDLGGHELQVKLGNMTEKEFQDYERRRWYALYRQGWKEIRIISKKDKIPSDNKIKEIITFAKNYLNSGHNFIKFYLDEGLVKTSQFENNFDFGELRYIYKKDVNSA